LHNFKDKLGYDVAEVAFSADGKTVVTSSTRLRTERPPPRREDRGKPSGADARNGAELRFWDAEGGKLRCTLTVRVPVGLIAVAPDGQTVAIEESVAPAGGGAGRPGDFTVLRLYDVSAPKWKLRATLPGANEPVTGCTALHFFPNGKSLAAVLCKRKGLQFVWEVAVWDVTTGKSQGNALELKDTPETEYQIERLVFSSSPALFAVTASKREKSDNAKAAHETGVWEASKFRDGKLTTLKHEDPLSHIFFSPDRQLALSVCRFGQRDEKPFHYAQLWDLGSGKEVPIPPHKDMVGDLTAQFSPDSRFIALADGEGRLKVVDATQRTLLLTYEASRPARFDPLVFSPDSKTLASVEKRNTVKLWDLTSSRELATCTPTIDFGSKRDLRFSSDGKTLTAFDGKSLTQWEVRPD
jgi:WD40 repeat protein